ncbi:MAG: two-component regulator propeller domain-containing protein [Desulfobacter postgatei]|nr:two-component regulator propeller domain-containing protein [Desulfobacter postgatei]MDD4272462.1 two-component regulator propeller domain-containing protein [Desulfobacter postgatei]
MFSHPFDTGSYNCGITQDRDGFIWVGTRRNSPVGRI